MKKFKDYSWYQLPDGWIRLFKQMCNDIDPILRAMGDSAYEEFNFLQVKEKFGQMRVYTTPIPEEAQVIIEQYEYISQFICVDCGRPAQKETIDYIVPMCNDCYNMTNMTESAEICFTPIMEIKRFSTNGVERFQYDVTDIWERYIND